MKEDPFIALYGMMQSAGGQSSPTATIGTIITPPPEITISYNGFTLNKNDIYINNWLLKDYYREYKGHIKSATQDRSGGSGDAQYESHNHDIDNDYTLTSYTTDTLKKNDKVLLLPMTAEDGSTQKYVVMCKIVNSDMSEIKGGM